MAIAVEDAAQAEHTGTRTVEDAAHAERASTRAAPVEDDVHPERASTRAVAVEDAVHAERAGASFLPWPSIPAAHPKAYNVRVVLCRARDLPLLGRRFGFSGTLEEAVLIACLVHDESDSGADPVSPAWVPLSRAEASARTPIIVEPESALVGTAPSELHALLAPSQARLVVDGLALRVRQTSKERIVARRDDSLEPVAVEATWALAVVDANQDGQSSTDTKRSRDRIEIQNLNLVAQLGLQEVDVAVTVRGVAVDGIMQLNEESSATVTQLRTWGLALQVDSVTADQLIRGVRSAIASATTLREDDVSVFVSGDTVWVVDLAAGGNGACAWLAEHLVRTRAFWVRALGRG